MPTVKIMEDNMTKQRRTKKLVILGAIFILFTFVIVSLTCWYFVDISPQDFSDLIIVRKNTPVNQNAFTYFSKAGKLVGKISHEDQSALYGHLHGKPYDKKQLALSLEKKQGIFAQVNLGFECNYFHCPEKEYNSGSPFLIYFRNVTFYITRMAMLQCDTGRWADSIKTTDDLLKYSQIIMSDPDSRMGYIVCYEPLYHAISLYRKLICSPLSVSQLQHIKKKLDSVELNKGIIVLLKNDFNTHKKLLNNPKKMKDIVAFYRPKMKMPRYLLKQNATSLLFAKHYRELINGTKKTYKQCNTTFLNNQIRQANSSLSFLKPNLTGRMFFCIMALSNSFAKRKFTQQCSLDAIRLQIACKLYKRKYGKYPKKLQQLVPEFIDAVPIDPFDGKPFRYSYENKIVYSVGPDLKDSGCTKPGQPQTEIFDRKFKPRKDDLIFSIEHIKSICQQ